MWAVGCVLGELLKGAPLFPGQTEQEMVSLIIELLGHPTEVRRSRRWFRSSLSPDGGEMEARTCCTTTHRNLSGCKGQAARDPRVDGPTTARQ